MPVEGGCVAEEATGCLLVDLLTLQRGDDFYHWLASTRSDRLVIVPTRKA